MTGSEPAQQVRLDKLREADERQLVEAAQRDRARFADLYDRYFEMVYAYVARRLRDRAATEDVTSEVFRKALQNLPKFKWTGAPFGAWLLRIASNVIADRAKRAAREQQVEPSLTVGLLPRGQSVAVQAQGTDLEDAERRACLFRLVGELAEDQQRVVMLRFAEEKTIREIATELDKSEGAIKQLQFRALKNLRKRILTTEDTEEENRK
ncbi:MAG TPA: RNA polymerase sigma factor [Pyrinomonadaceae bacterium]